MKDVYQWKLVPETRLQAVSSRPSTTAKYLLAFGNLDKSDLRNRRSEILNFVSNHWKIYTDLTCKRDGFCSAVIGDELYVLGGGCDLTATNSVTFSSTQ